MSKKDKGLNALENISYENGDDLTEHIARLVAPPNNCKISAGSNTTHQTSKNIRPNNDFCSFCSEGGRLICCEQCPAAFHYHCCEPPLDPNNLPSDEWLCNTCKQLISPPQPTVEKNKYLKFAKLDMGTMPCPYELPGDMYPGCDLPGSTEMQSRKRKNYNPGFATEQYKRKFNTSKYPEDQYVFTPTPVCYKCDKSDRRNKPLIFCSYCPLAFHLDCVYPPLPFRPNGLWMCPLHPQYSSPNFHALRLSTRLEAHEKCLDAVNEHSVRSKFLKKSKKNQPVITESDKGLQRLTNVPGAIEQYYKIGLAFCRNNVTLKSPKSLKELSADSLSAKMAKKEGPTSSNISSFCSRQNCRHAKKQCKHYTVSHSSDKSLKKHAAECEKSRENEIKLGDNGVKSQNIDEMVEGMSEKKLRQLAKQLLQQNKGPVLPNGYVTTLEHVPPADVILPPPPPRTSGRTENCLAVSHIVAHSFLQQGDTKYSIKTNSFVIGIGIRADLKLDPEVCKAVSLRHAVILFDKVTGIHELLNYSEYGTIVSDLLYGCSAPFSRCPSCSPKIALHGWEGPCRKIPDGAVIRIGCHSFTFHRNPDFVWSPEIIIPPEASSERKHPGQYL